MTSSTTAAAAAANSPTPSTRPHRSREGATRDLAVRHLQGVSTLLGAREDLRGVYAFADVVEESLRWSA